MNTENIAKRLVLGSSNIDRMSHEIKHTVKMLLGHADSLCGVGEWEIDQSFQTPLVVWYIAGSPFWNPKLVVRCWLKIDETQAEILGYSSRDGEKSLSVGSIQAVHATLDDFVEGMLKTFPGLEERLQPLLEASEKVF